MSKKNNHENKQAKSVRIIALILAGLMLVSVATVAISLLAELGHDHDTEQTDPHAGHNHD